MGPKKSVSALLICIALLQACIKKNIQFGTDLGETSTRIIEVDTLSVDMSTFIVDSFPTNRTTDFLVGRYYDSALGTLTAKPFLQLSLPSDKTVESNAVYDSSSFLIRLNKYYYGDTAKAATIVINELDGPIDYTYNNQLFNTSSISEKPWPLGSVFVKINPSVTDSVVIKIDDAKGLALFNNLKNSSAEVTDNSAFLNFFKGVSIGFLPGNQSAVYGMQLSSNSIVMRLHYHTNTPYLQKKTKDFIFDSTRYFNQLVTDRSGSLLAQFPRGLVSSLKTSNNAYTQAAAGVLLKMTFPTLRNMLQLDPTVKLLKATLKLKVAKGSHSGKYKLPARLFLSHTDATNLVGNSVTNSDGSILYGELITDNIYDEGSFYSFNLTSYINTLMTTGGGIDNGFFLMEVSPGYSAKVNRVVIDDSFTGESKLILSLFTLKN